jgi:uncharacterized protein YlxW (UPF0749 family)
LPNQIISKEFETNKIAANKTLQDHSKLLNRLQNPQTNSKLDRLREENIELQKLSEELSERIKKLSYILADLKSKARTADKEEARLITAIKLLYKLRRKKIMISS